MSGWIKSTDRLPRLGQVVIITDRVHEWQVGTFKGIAEGDPKRWRWKWSQMVTALYWMPKEGALPPVPEE